MSTTRRQFLAGATAVGAGVTLGLPGFASAAADLRLRYGVCMHSNFRSSVYAQDDRILSSVVGLGWRCRWVRDLMVPSGSIGSFSQVQLWDKYRDANKRIHATTGIYSKPFTETDWLALPGRVERSADVVIEMAGYNEPDSNSEPISRWLEPTVAHQKRLYETVKGNPATAHIRVGLGALRGENANLDVEMRQLTDAARGYYDFVNLHLYPKQNDVAAYLDEHFAMSESWAPGVQIIISEVGASTSNQSLTRQADIAEQAVRHSRLRGHKCYIYELMDDAGTSVQANFGIIENDFSDKPAAIRLRALSVTP